MKEFIDKLIERLEEKAYNHFDLKLSDAISIANELAEEYKEECNLDCDKLLFAYSDLLRRFQNAEETVICEFSGNISKETEELEAECEELLSQFKEILHSANSPQKSAEEYINTSTEHINCSTDISTKSIDYSTKVSEMPTGWIPCSERLPEEDKMVLCQGKNNMFIGFVDSFDGEWTDNNHYRRTNVKAWCELPAPYTEGESR